MALDSLFAIARGLTRGRAGVRKRRLEDEALELDAADRERARTREATADTERAADRATRDQDRRLRLSEGGYVPADTPEEDVRIKLPGVPGLYDTAAEIALPRYERLPGAPEFKRDRTNNPDQRRRQEAAEARVLEGKRDEREQGQALERIRAGVEGGIERDRVRPRTAPRPTGGATAGQIAGHFARAPSRTRFTKKTLTGGTVVDETAYQQAARAWRQGGVRLGLSETELDAVLEPGDEPPAPGSGAPVPPAEGPNLAQLRQEAADAIARGANRAAVAARFKKLTGQDL